MGIAKAMWDPEDVSAVGRVLERSRFKRSGGCGARESALQASGVTRRASGKCPIRTQTREPRAPGRWILVLPRCPPGSSRPVSGALAMYVSGSAGGPRGRQASGYLPEHAI
eukprot:2269914-Pyramimonas_sp.AAC.1